MGLCTISVPEDFCCPFDIDEFSFLQWFNKQTFQDVHAATVIFFILKTLNQQQIAVKTRFLILHKLNEILPVLSDILVNSFIDKPFPLQDNLASYAMLAADLEMELSNGYHQLTLSDEFSTQDGFSPQQKILIIYNGLKALNKAQLHFSLFYFNVNPGFWQRVFGFFLLATEKKLTKDKFNEQHDSIEKVFKGILAFFLCNTRQFDQHEILKISGLIASYSEFIELLHEMPEKKFKGLPAFCLTLDKPPALTGLLEQQVGVLYIATARLAAQILNATKSENIDNIKQYLLNRESTFRRIKSLSLNAQRKHEREKTETNCSLLVGFESLRNFLLPNHENQMSQAIESSYFTSKNEDLSGLDLDMAIFSNQFDHQISDDFMSEDMANRSIFLTQKKFAKQNQSIWDIAKNKKETLNTLIDISPKGLGILLSNHNNKLLVKELIGVLDKNSQLLGIGLVRHIAYVGQSLSVGVELLAKEVSLVSVSSILTDDSIELGLLFFDPLENNLAEIILLSGNDFRIEQTFSVKKATDKVQLYKLLSVLHTSSDYTHYRITLLSH